MADSLPDGMSDADPPPETPKPLPQPPVPRTERLADETTPVAVEFSRFSQADLANFGWLMQRLGEHYRHIHTTTWAGRLRMYMGDNGHLFIRTKNAVLLATMARDPMGTEPYVLPIWCFHSMREFASGTGAGSSGERESIALLREAARWGGRAGAKEMRCSTMVCDTPVDRLERLLEAEKREELVVRIR